MKSNDIAWLRHLLNLSHLFCCLICTWIFFQYIKTIDAKPLQVISNLELEVSFLFIIDMGSLNQCIRQCVIIVISLIYFYYTVFIVTITYCNTHVSLWILSFLIDNEVFYWIATYRLLPPSFDHPYAQNTQLQYINPGLYKMPILKFYFYALLWK